MDQPDRRPFSVIRFLSGTFRRTISAIILLAILTGIFFLVAFFWRATANQPNSELNTNEILWNRLAITDYSYRLEAYAAGRTDEALITVRESFPFSANRTDSTNSNPGNFDDSDTIPKLFGIVRNVNGGYLIFSDRSGDINVPEGIDLSGLVKAEEIRVSYDPFFGYPEDIFVDPVKAIIDDEWGFRVFDFSILEPLPETSVGKK